ncbi:MAG: glycosyltransferase, partial [Verrucomicrobiota bacterium]
GGRPVGPVIWLAYVSCPYTTAVYFERALRSDSQVITCGPRITTQIIDAWNLRSMNVPVQDQDLPLDWTPDMGGLIRDHAATLPLPDLYLWIESVPGYHPTNLSELRCPKACYLIDNHLNLEAHLHWAREFDQVFIAQREYLGAFRAAGIRNVHWLPLGCDPEIHGRHDVPKRIDVGFVGSIGTGSRREQLLQSLAAERLLVEPRRIFLREMSAHLSKSRIGFNNALRNDLNMRVFETLCSGTFLLTDAAAGSGQDELFRAGEDLGIYEDPELPEQARHWLIHEEEREAIARRGSRMALAAHTYRHRCEDLMAVCLQGKPSTFSAGELRERSLAGSDGWDVGSAVVSPTPGGRSFIIPVLDADLDKADGFHALLRDLGGVDGEVIAIFNSAEAAEAYRNHPRINLSASLNVNVGVGRAWNIGTHLATGATLFFMNADLRVTAGSIDLLESSLWQLPDAGVVGPEGGFFRFSTYGEQKYFDKGEALRPTPVDSVSGFFFATKRELFTRKTILFENAYTPCFTEEWDLALQLKMAGLRGYVVPVTGYSHPWGVSKDPHRVIRYYGSESARACEILSRNRIHFWRKWIAIAADKNLVRPPEPTLGADASPPASRRRSP